MLAIQMFHWHNRHLIKENEICSIFNKAHQSVEEEKLEFSLLHCTDKSQSKY